MILKWLDSSESAKLGIVLADGIASTKLAGSNTGGKPASATQLSDALPAVLQRAEREISGLHLNFYKKAKLANSFRWRLIESGVEKNLAEELTQRLVLHMSATKTMVGIESDVESANPPQSYDSKELLALGNKFMAQGAYNESIPFYQDLIKLNPRHAAALNNLGTAFFKLGHLKEAEAYFNQAVRIKPDYPDAHSNIGTTLLLKGQYTGAESFLRHALKLNPRFVDARVNLGLTLAFSNRSREAKSHLEKALKYEPRSPDALFGLSFIAKMEGSFKEAATFLARTLEVSPRMPKALASQSGMRKMTPVDSSWLDRAEEVAASGIAPMDESDLRFAIGKYYDDVENFKLAFQNYKRANDLLKSMAEPYDRDGYRHFVDTMIAVYTPEVIGRLRDGASSSMKPVFVVGMPRSGTSLTEQIISSHPSAAGAGELEFWSAAVHEHEAIIKKGQLDQSTRNKLAESYLRFLTTKSGEALRVVDKAPVNSDYLGIIYSVFPKARIIYMQRNPIDTCLSCYFQKFVLSLNFTMDLSDLADYYCQHQRLMAHWRAVLPPETLLDVPYEELVADQEGWTRKILDFLGLEWNAHVLDFHNTKRAVATASFWQVRQKIYKSSVQRWRNYERFIGPLLALKD